MTKADNRFLGDLDATSNEVKPALVVEHADAHGWDESCDVLVVGIGLAGTAAALRAAEDRSLEVIALDRGLGGGASALSGGVLYVGGSAVQRDCGVEDTPENMANYLALEVGDIVRPDTLRNFCRASASFLPWLEGHGAKFGGPVTTAKTSYPGTSFLYFSGNERIPAARAVATPAPRGHRALPRDPRRLSEQSGVELMTPLLASLDAQPNVRVQRQTRVERLVVDRDGAVVGLEALRIPAGAAAKRHAFVYKLGLNMMFGVLGLLGPVRRSAARIERKAAERVRIRVRKGVVLSAGGFIFNRAMVDRLAPAYNLAAPIGSIGDDGSGIKLGMSVGGKADNLHRISAWRFIYPPSAWTKSVTIGPDGKRLLSEELYGAQTGEAVFEKGRSKGWLVLDSKLQAKVREEMVSKELMNFQRLQTKTSVKRYTAEAETLEALANKIGVPAGALRATIETHNRDIAEGRPDAFGKSEELRVPVEKGPFYATSIEGGLRFSPITGLTMGGLVIDEETGQVLDTDGKGVPGLFAAGRTAVGICSNYYVSGLSLADCMFSGWRAAETLKGRGGIHGFVPGEGTQNPPA